MQFVAAILALAAMAVAVPNRGHGNSQVQTDNICSSTQTVVCQGQGNGGLITLGNVAPGVLGQNCAAGDVYCCSQHDVEQQNGLINLDLKVQCSLNRVL